MACSVKIYLSEGGGLDIPEGKGTQQGFIRLRTGPVAARRLFLLTSLFRGISEESPAGLSLCFNDLITTCSHEPNLRVIAGSPLKLMQRSKAGLPTSSQAGLLLHSLSLVCILIYSIYKQQNDVQALNSSFHHQNTKGIFYVFQLLLQKKITASLVSDLEHGSRPPLVFGIIVFRKTSP